MFDKHYQHGRQELSGKCISKLMAVPQVDLNRIFSC